MELLKHLLPPRPTPRQQLRDWQRHLRSERLALDRRVRGHASSISPANTQVRREEKKVEKAIREAARRDDMGSAKALAKELVRSRRAVNRLYENMAQISSVSMRLGEIIGTERTVGHLSESAEVLKTVNDLMKAPELALTMQQFSKEILKAGTMEEIVNDMVDSALDSEDVEDEIEEEVNKVLGALAVEIASQLPSAQTIKQDSMSTVPRQRQTVSEQTDDNQEDLDEIIAQLSK
ncbi:hypothetical protein ACP70R_022984 [Stipagrostis hirtigluma subsp. patula]